jgi:hypothetical protein
MARKKIGSFFQGILDKSPEMAKRLEGMAKNKKAMPETDTFEKLEKESTNSNTENTARKNPTRIKHLDRMEGVVVEKRSISPDHQAKKKASKISKLRGDKKSEKKTRSIKPRLSKSKHQDIKKSNTDGRFFSGIPENAHQFGLNDGMSKIDIVLGVDFGTSSTKVILRIPNFTGDPAFAVPFGDLAHNSLKYLLPTSLSIESDGRCSLAPIKNSSILTNIKIGLMRNPNGTISSVSGTTINESPLTVSAAYIALVLRYVRAWFIENKREIFGEYSLNWICNFGLPAAIDDDSVLRDSYNLACKAAWLLSRQTGPITISGARKAITDIRSARFSEDDMPWDLTLMPEVVAEVAGYARSQFRNEGLHLLVDVGASTLDVCSFILHKKQGDDDVSILTADVGSLGAKELHFDRIKAAKLSIDVHAKNIFEEDDLVGMIPNSLDVYAPETEVICKKISEAQNIFKAECNNLLYKTLVDLRKRRDPNSPRWSDTLPVFLCGGASAMTMYQDSVSGISEGLKKFISSSQGARLMPMLKPESLVADVDDESYHRLAVAWGLSHEDFNIATYSRPSEIEDVPPPPVRNFANNFVSKDMV